MPPDVQREKADEASDLHKKVDDDGEARVEGERVDGRHCNALSYCSTGMVKKGGHYVA